ncbi:Rmf/CrpP family protein [uncultured Methylobacterium sp.]|uniref:ribosome modulation factor n=1 Tax=uncultured Methylobacterium sp. TaxID=157278 RepID=UPI0035CB4003
MTPDANAQATASDSPFIEGRNARLYGKPASDCPYPEGSEERAAWMQAYEEAAVTDAG